MSLRQVSGPKPRKRNCLHCHRRKSVDGYHCERCVASFKAREARAYKRQRQQPRWMDHEAMQALVDELDRTMERPEVPA